MAALLIIQPVLDVLSFCFQDSFASVITTTLRFLMLATVCFYGFVVTDRKELYFSVYGLVGAFWVLHMLSSLRGGYAHPISDAAEFLKLIQLPLWMLSFITFFRLFDGLDNDMLGVLTVNLGIIIAVILLSYLTGTQVYTYDNAARGIQIGVMGWFGVHSAQSAILCILVPAVLLWGLRSESLPVFTVTTVLGLGLLYLTGTRITYFTAIILTLAFLAMIILCRKPMIFTLPVLVALILLLIFMGRSPMSQRQEISQTSFSTYQTKIDLIMGTDKDFTYKKRKENDPAVMEKVERVYTEIYGTTGVYGEVLLEDLIDRFGVDKVMEAYNYTISSKELNNGRTRKLIAMKLLWQEEDFLTHLLGMEYSSCEINGHIYAPENDFPALLYFNGYIGAGIYLIFVIGLALYAISEFIHRFPTLLNVEFITAAVMLALGFGAALVSGSVLYRPNVTVYLSLAAATLFVQTEQTPSIARLRSSHRRNPAVYLKKLG